MKSLAIIITGLVSIIISACAPDEIQPMASLVNIYCTYSSNATFGKVHLDSQRLFYSRIIYYRKDVNDSAYAQTKPLFFVDFSIDKNQNAKIDSSYIPSGLYNKLSFLYFKSATDSVLADSAQALIQLVGNINSTPFLFRSAAKFTLYFPDSSLNIPKGKIVNLSLNFDLNKVLDPQLGGIDISQAVDGNKDGYIDISANNIDGNATLAQQILSSIVKNASIKSQ